MNDVVEAPPLNYFGGKWKSAPWYIENMPPHKTFVDLFGGGCNIILRKPRSKYEIYNDLDGEVINFFRIIQNPDTCQKLFRLLKRIPYAREAFYDAYNPTDDTIQRAANLAIKSHMSIHVSAMWKGKGSNFHSTTRSSRFHATTWIKFQRTIPQVRQRLQGVVIENKDAIKLIPQFDYPDTLFFADPPYMPETRKGASYGCEMTPEQHAALLDALIQAQGNAMVCGYDNQLYREKLAGWKLLTRKGQAMMSGHKGRIECLWIKMPMEEKTGGVQQSLL